MEEKNVSFGIKGMTCASCVNRVERSLKKIEGVKFVSVNLATEKAFITTDLSVSEEELKNAVKKVGYELTEKAPTNDEMEERFKETRKNLLITLSATIPLIILMFFHMIGFHIPLFHWIELILGGFVVFYCGRKTLKGAWIALSHFHTNMDTLISLGAISAWITTALHLAGMHIFSFGSLSAMIVAFHIAGRYIEAKLKHKASKDIRNMLSMKVENANLIYGEEIIKVPIENVKLGSEIIVKTGEKIPLDGIIIEGNGYIDESMITGEPIPVNKSISSEVIGGTILNSGVLKIKVEKVGEDTFLNQMIKLIEEAQSSKVPIQAFADKITKIFIPVVFFLALLSGIIWYFNYENFLPFLHNMSNYIPWITHGNGALSTAVFVFVATLVIACPCALGLATPMALVAGSGVAAKKGLIIKSGESIQLAKDLDILLLDKTGTITLGEPQVVESNLIEEEISVIASLEENSIHPLATAVVNYAKYKNIFKNYKLNNVEEISGKGILGYYNEDLYFIGKPVESLKYEEMMRKGYTVIEVSKNNEIIGYLAISDPIKEDSIDAIKRIKNSGIKTIMVTGDNEITAEKVAKLVGLDDFIAGVKPEEKANIVRKYQREGKKVGMVGDGINDAAALKTADIGIAIGTGTDLAIESADIVIIKGQLSKVYDAIQISKVTFKKIKQNLFSAFIYNMVAIPLAMTGLLHPVIAEVAMIFSSLNVIINSSRIRRQ